MDIVVFGIIVALFASITSRRREIAEQMNLIDDYKKWDSDEARFRSTVRALRSGRTSRIAHFDTQALMELLLICLVITSGDYSLSSYSFM